MKILSAIAALAMAASAFAQGTIVFQNRNIPTMNGSGTYNVPIWECVNTTGSNAAGDLPGGVTVGLFTQTGELIGSSLLRTDAAPSLNSGFFATAAQTLTVPNAAPGSTPTLIVRAWQGPGTFADATAAGRQYMDEFTNPRNQFTTRPLGGTPVGGGLPITPPGMTGWGPETGAGLSLFCLPEPSTYALSIVGVAALYFFNRKSKTLHI
jgi:hypothetical protein